MVCEWPVVYPVCDSPTGNEFLTGECAPGGFVATRRAAPEFEAMAVGFLDSWTRGMFGVCDVTVRPCVVSECDSSWSTFWGNTAGGTGYPSRDGWGVGIEGRWFPMVCGSCADYRCVCPRSGSIALPGPVEAVTRVQVGDTVLTPGQYRVTGHRFLSRTDGGAWPRVQDFCADRGAPDTFFVDYRRGVPVPEGGRIAAGVLALEMEKAACGADDCALPSRLQSVTRQGVQVDVVDSWQDLKDGQTGLWLVDTWVQSVVCPARRATVSSPDFRRR